MEGAEQSPDAATVSHSITISAPADEVWHVVRDVGAIGAWLPGVESSRLEGDSRIIEYSGGGQAREQILDIDEARRTYTYRLLAGRLPITWYEAGFSVEELETGAAVHWTGTFVPGNPADARGIAETLHQFFESSLDALGRKFAHTDVEET